MTDFNALNADVENNSDDWEQRLQLSLAYKNKGEINKALLALWGDPLTPMTMAQSRRVKELRLLLDPEGRVDLGMYVPLVVEGSTVTGAKITNSIVGIRARVDRGSVLKDVILMGSDFYEGEQKLGENARQTGDIPRMGVGKNCHLERCIIDKNARIGDGVIIKTHPDITDYTGERRWIRDGITIIPKGTIIEPGTEL